MQLTREDHPPANVVRAYAPGQIQVNQQRISGSVIVAADRVLPDWPPRRVEELTAEHLRLAVELEPEIIILGSGASTRFPPAELVAQILGRRIGFEVMDNAAACRTYNVLVAEARAVVLALIMEA